MEVVVSDVISLEIWRQSLVRLSENGVDLITIVFSTWTLWMGGINENDVGIYSALLNQNRKNIDGNGHELLHKEAVAGMVA